MAQREYIFVLKIILNGVAKAPPLKLSPSLELTVQGFSHSNQNDARALKHQCLKGSFNEPVQIYVDYAFSVHYTLAREIIFFSEKWGMRHNVLSIKNDAFYPKST